MIITKVKEYLCKHKSNNINNDKEYTCPYCGGTDIDLGCNLYLKGLLKRRIYRADYFKCKSCNTEWESKLYRVG